MRKTGLAAVLLLALGLATGCGGGDRAGEDLVKGLRSPDTETRAKMVRFAQCMRDAGHDVPDPGPDGFDFTKFTGGDADFRNAAKECHEKHPFVDLGDIPFGG